MQVPTHCCHSVAHIIASWCASCARRRCCNAIMCSRLVFGSPARSVYPCTCGERTDLVCLGLVYGVPIVKTHTCVVLSASPACVYQWSCGRFVWSPALLCSATSPGFCIPYHQGVSVLPPIAQHTPGIAVTVKRVTGATNETQRNMEHTPCDNVVTAIITKSHVGWQTFIVVHLYMGVMVPCRGVVYMCTVCRCVFNWKCGRAAVDE